MPIFLPDPEIKLCGEQPCWLPEGDYKTNGRCAFTGCLLPYMWQCRRIDCQSAAEEEALTRRYPHDVKVIVVDEEGHRCRYNALADVSKAFDVGINYVRYHRNRGIIKKGAMEGYKIIV